MVMWAASGGEGVTRKTRFPPAVTINTHVLDHDRPRPPACLSSAPRPLRDRRLQSTPPWQLDRRTLATAPRASGRPAQHVARGLGTPPDHQRHDGRRRAMLAALAI